MRDLINKLTLLESSGTLSIQAIASSIEQSAAQDKLVFYFTPSVNLPLDLKEGPATITQYLFHEFFKVDESGYLKYAFPGTSIDFQTKFATMPTDNEDNRKIIGDNAIKTFNQVFGINDVDSIRYDYIDFNLYNRVSVKLPLTKEFLAVVDNAYQWRQETIGDL